MTKLSQEYCTVCRNLCLSQRRNYVYQNEQHQTLLTVSLADAGCSFIFSSFKVLKFKHHFLWGNQSTNLHVGCNSQWHPRFQTQIISNIIILIKYLAYPSSTTNKSTKIQSVYPQWKVIGCDRYLMIGIWQLDDMYIYIWGNRPKTHARLLVSEWHLQIWMCMFCCSVERPRKGGIRFATGLNTAIYKPTNKRKPDHNLMSRFCWGAKGRARFAKARRKGSFRVP